MQLRLVQRHNLDRSLRKPPSLDGFGGECQTPIRRLRKASMKHRKFDHSMGIGTTFIRDRNMNLSQIVDTMKLLRTTQPGSDLALRTANVLLNSDAARRLRVQAHGYPVSGLGRLSPGDVQEFRFSAWVCTYCHSSQIPSRFAQSVMYEQSSESAWRWRTDNTSMKSCARPAFSL